MTNIAVFASGSGTNAENLMNYFSDSEIKITRLFTNNPQALVIQRANACSVPVTVFSKDDLYTTNTVIEQLKKDNVQFIVLSGFLLLVPAYLITAFPDRIINIHPALLPKYGGKGMYGNNVHKAVVQNKEQETGITIHLIDEIYDNGRILFQARCSVAPTDTYLELAQKVHALEYEHYPPVVQDYITSFCASPK